MTANQTLGCNGGDPYAAYAYIHAAGVTDDTCMNYVAQNEACVPINVCRNCSPNNRVGCFAVDSPPTYTVSEFGSVAGVDNMMNELFARGPISCTIAVTEAFENYQGGVFVDTTGAKSLDHEVDLNIPCEGRARKTSNQKHNYTNTYKHMQRERVKREREKREREPERTRRNISIINIKTDIFQISVVGWGIDQGLRLVLYTPSSVEVHFFSTLAMLGTKYWIGRNSWGNYWVIISLSAYLTRTSRLCSPALVFAHVFACISG